MTAIQQALTNLAAHLREKRAETLLAWRSAVMADGMLPTAHALPRMQLDDHIPGLLETYSLRLETESREHLTVVMQQGHQAEAHGLHRWQQGYGLQEVALELGRLNEAVVAQLERYAQQRPERDAEAMIAARRVWAEIIGVESSRSIAEYFRLQQLEAAGHLQDLEQALNNVRELEQERADLWHQAAHDLRGNFGVVRTATAGLSKTGPGGQIQEKFLRILDRNVASLHQRLDDVTDLARLHAGKEQRRVAEIDIASFLMTLVADLHEHANQRGLYLKWNGPGAFVVDGDAVKIRRLVQNLVINSLKYTKRGGVTVSWGDIGPSDPKRWFVSVQDSGPGFDAGPGSPMADALEQATQAAEQPTMEDSRAGDSMHGKQTSMLSRSTNTLMERGEGIGLSIVKRLAELLDATVEVESNAKGTTFRILLPRVYLR